eukprot:6913947-Prymnesium_polylepis.1
MRSTSSACCSIRASVHWPLGLEPDWDQKTPGSASLWHVPTSYQLFEVLPNGVFLALRRAAAPRVVRGRRSTLRGAQGV